MEERRQHSRHGIEMQLEVFDLNSGQRLGRIANPECHSMLCRGMVAGTHGQRSAPGTAPNHYNFHSNICNKYGG